MCMIQPLTVCIHLANLLIKSLAIGDVVEAGDLEIDQNLALLAELSLFLMMRVVLALSQIVCIGILHVCRQKLS